MSTSCHISKVVKRYYQKNRHVVIQKVPVVLLASTPSMTDIYVYYYSCSNCSTTGSSGIQVAATGTRQPMSRM
jgi:hypothetical protein